MKKVLAIVLMLLLVFSFAACGGETEEVQTTFAVGETATVDGVNYTVNSVTKSAGSDWDYPAEGNEYVIVEVTIENKSDEKISYNVFDWAMLNSQGQEDGEAFTTIDTDTNLGSGELRTDGVKTGTMIFEEPIGEELTLLYYSNSLFDDEPAFEVVLQ